MKFNEIITNPPRDEYLDQYHHKLKHSEPVATIKNLTLKKASSSTEIVYGLYNSRDQPVGYFELEYRGKNIWEVVVVQLAQAYKGMGYGTFFYDYAIMNDKFKVMSDATNTGGPYGSKNLWSRLINNKRYSIVGYDTKTGEIMSSFDFL